MQIATELEFHPLANIFPLLPDAELRELANSIKIHGLQEPIILHEGKILDGRNRYKACELAGAEPLIIEWVSDGISALDYVITRNLHRRHLDESQRAMVAAKLATLQKGRPSENVPIGTLNRAGAAQLLNVGERSVSRAREVLDAGVPELIEAVERGSIAVSAAADITELPKEVQREIVQEVVSGEKTVSEAKRVHVANNSGNNEWYTPPELIEAAREVMGSIDTDPASSDIANKTVKAEYYFTAEDNGLEQDWDGNVWMNPPYAQPLIADFAEALASKFISDEIDQACVLVNNATETGWFRTLAEASNAVCFLKGRVRFIDPEGNPSGAPLQGQAILYFGPRASFFAQTFKRFGYVFVGRPVGFTG